MRRILLSIAVVALIASLGSAQNDHFFAWQSQGLAVHRLFVCDDQATVLRTVNTLRWPLDYPLEIMQAADGVIAVWTK